MTPRPKNSQPVTEAQADRIFAKVFREKVSGGYTDSASSVSLTPCVFDLNSLSGAATPAQNASISTVAAAPQPTGINVQLLTTAEDAELEDLFTDDDFAAQEKYDGKRVALVLDKGDVYGAGRTGLKCGIPATLTVGVGKVAGLRRQVFNVPVGQLIPGLTHLKFQISIIKTICFDFGRFLNRSAPFLSPSGFLSSFQAAKSRTRALSADFGLLSPHFPHLQFLDGKNPCLDFQNLFQIVVVPSRL